MRVFPIIKKTIIQSGGGPNPTDAFSLRIQLVDTSPALSDAMSIALLFPELVGAQSDTLQFGLVIPDTNPALVDALLSLGLRLVESNISATDAMSLGIGFSDTNPALNDSLGIAFTLVESNPSVVDALLSIGIRIADTNISSTDSVVFLLNLALVESNQALADVFSSLRISGLGDNNAALSDVRTSLARFWLSGSAGANVTNPANANGSNNGTVSSQQTVALGATTTTMTSDCGSNIPAATAFATAVYRGWYNLTLGLAGSYAIKVHSSSALFVDITMVTGATVNHLSGDFTFDLVAAGVDTLAKLRSAQILHITTDAVAGVNPTILTVDAGAIELTGAV